MKQLMELKVYKEEILTNRQELFHSLIEERNYDTTK